MAAPARASLKLRDSLASLSLGDATPVLSVVHAVELESKSFLKCKSQVEEFEAQAYSVGISLEVTAYRGLFTLPLLIRGGNRCKSGTLTSYNHGGRR